MPRQFLPLACCLLMSAAFAAGCGSKRAPTAPDGPPLAMSEPPPRVFAPIEDDEPIASAPVAPDTPATPPPRPITPNRPTPRRATPAESERAEQPAAQTTPVPTPEAPRELRAASAPADPESERKINDLIRRANQSLNNVYYQGLSTARKELYDQAKAFIKDGEQALKERNFIYAETLADKAAKLATELAR